MTGSRVLVARPRMKPLCTTVALFLALPLLTGDCAAAQTLPDLPQPPLETYEPAIRRPIAEAYEDALEKPDDAARNGILGMVLYAHEQYEYAVPCFERAHVFDPGEGRWSYYLGRAQLFLARYDKAAASFRETLRLRPGYLPAEMRLAQTLLDADRRDEALALYQELEIRHPDTAEVHYGLGRLYAARGDTGPAVTHLGRACELEPTFGGAHFALARVYRGLGEKEKAKRHLALYQKDKLGWPILPDPLLADITALRNSSTDHLRRGIELAEQGQLKEAAEEHEAVIEIDPTLVQAHVNLIRLYGQLGEPSRAEEHYRAALEIDPNLAELHYNYGVLLNEQDPAGAAEAFRRALELKPTYAEAHNNYAFFLMTTGKLDDAARHYRVALEERPDYRAARFNLARILVQQGHLDEAISHLRRTLLPEDGETPRLTYALGTAYARSGNRAEALRYLHEAREKATALGQSALLVSIEKDLRALEKASSPQ